MKDWVAVVVARPEPQDGPMSSRLPSYLHPIAGRPVVWHTVNELAIHPEPPSLVTIIAPPELPEEIFDGLGVDVRIMSDESPDPEEIEPAAFRGRAAVVLHASAFIEHEPLRRLVVADDGEWIGGNDDTIAAIRIHPTALGKLLERSDPFDALGAAVDPLRRLLDTPGAFVIQTRADLSRAHERIRDSLVAALMSSGATFILPESVVVDVDVRIGRDTIVYPSVVIEGQTTIGQETVIGPGCRIINGWIGSGVELKGWNYIANTSIRNRAILEPYVRRGFD